MMSQMINTPESRQQNVGRRMISGGLSQNSALLLPSILLPPFFCLSAFSATERPNVLMIVVDDMNDWVGWRYIRYTDGSEELYDHDTDPNEWTNLASKPEFATIKNELAKTLPKADAAALRSKKKRKEKELE